MFIKPATYTETANHNYIFISQTCFILKGHPQRDETLVGNPQCLQI